MMKIHKPDPDEIEKQRRQAEGCDFCHGEKVPVLEGHIYAECLWCGLRSQPGEVPQIPSPVNALGTIKKYC